METAEDSEEGLELEEIDNSPENGVLSNGPLKTEQVYQPCSDYHQALCQQYRLFKDNLVACSTISPLNSMVQMPTSAVINQAHQMPPNMMAAQQPGNVSEQLVVTVQNMNANAASVEDGDPKTIVNTGSMPNSIQMPKLSNSSASTSSMPQIATSGPVLAPAQLAGMMSLASLPQVTALAGLNGIPGLNMVQQLAAQPQVIQQQQVPSSGSCMPSNQMQAACPQSMTVSMNGQPQAVQAVQQQINNTPQFILAAGQPIQGIQGAQLLIPTSSGVATQQVITIPVSQLAGNQVVQLVASNGQIFTTTLANLQALSQPVPVPGIAPASIPANPQPVQPHPMLATTGYANMPGQMSALPQIFTNPAGQLITLGPQIIAHPMMSANQPASVVVNPQVAAAAAQMQQISQQQQQDDKNSGLPPIAHANGMTSSIPRTTNSSLSAISQALAMQQQSQAPQIAINPVTMVATQISSPQKSQQNGQNCPLAPKLPGPPGTVSALTQTIHPQISLSPSEDPDISLHQVVSTISNTEANVVDGINLEEIKEFAKAFKIRRLSLGLTQTQVGQALSATEGPSYSQSAICRFEKLDITPRSAVKIKPVLERWMKEAEERYKNGAHTLTEFIGSEPTKKRKRRTSFTPAALDILNQFFEKNTHPTGLEMTDLAEHLNYDREVVRVWFCNKRQALKNTIKKLKTEVPTCTMD